MFWGYPEHPQASLFSIGRSRARGPPCWRRWDTLPREPRPRALRSRVAVAVAPAHASDTHNEALFAAGKVGSARGCGLRARVRRRWSHEHDAPAPLGKRADPVARLSGRPRGKRGTAGVLVLHMHRQVQHRMSNAEYLLEANFDPQGSERGRSSRLRCGGVGKPGGRRRKAESATANAGDALAQGNVGQLNPKKNDALASGLHSYSPVGLL